ncbi:MAG: hypothetical protein KGL39_53885, partial [Patescibacteria group bacterium]|nr:hypothetical protein [Patescibacteria group bacterium]
TWWREAWDRIRDQGASPQTLRMLGQCEPNGDGRTVYAPSEIQADWITENIGPRLREVAGRELEFKARAAS